MSDLAEDAAVRLMQARAPMDVEQWLEVVEQMIQHARDGAWYYVMAFTPDEAIAATEVIESRLGWCPEISIVGQPRDDS